MSEATEAEPAAEPDDATEPLAPAAMTPAHPSGSARRALLLLTTGAGVLFASQTMMAVGVPLVGDGYGLTAAVIGIVIAVPAVIPLFLAVFLGRWVSRVGSRKALVLAGSAHVLGGLLCWLLPLLLSANGVSATTIGILSSLRSLAAILVRPWTVPITRFLGGSARALTWTLFLTAAAAAALAFPPYLPWIGLMQLLMGVGAGLTIPLAMAIGVASLPTHDRGPAVALRLMGNRVAQISGPLLLGAVAQALGFFSAFLLSGLVAGALATWVRRIRRGAEASGRMEGG